MPNPLLADACIFLESTSGDGGNHTDPTWWLSPDVRIAGPDTQGRAVTGPNTVEIVTRWKSGCAVPVGTGAVLVELWVGNPAVAMTPNNPNSTKQITTVGATGLVAGGSVVNSIQWTPSTSPSAVDGPGHKCLIARCYPDSLTPDPADFYLPQDPHAVQHNICVVVCGGPGAADAHGDCGFDVATVNLSNRIANNVTLRAIRDARPSKSVLAAVMPMLKANPSFRRLASAAPRHFAMRLRDFPNAKIRDESRPKGWLIGAG